MSDADLGPAISDMERRIAEVYGLRREWALGRPRGETRAHLASLIAAVRVLRATSYAGGYAAVIDRAERAETEDTSREYRYRRCPECQREGTSDE